jgi:hypothetical protein
VTNAKSIARTYGEDEHTWIGKKLMLSIETAT